MPIYDYLCSACDHRADILHGIHDPGPLFCPSCGADGTMRKQFAVPTVHFKGSGWAKKDRGGTSRTRAAASSGSGDSKAKGGETGAPASDGGTSDAPSSQGSDAATSSGPASDKVD